MVKRIAEERSAAGEGHWYRDDYLSSVHWQNTRRSALTLAHYRCQECGATERLDVHHLHYRTLGEENVGKDLKVLCRPCHEAAHVELDESKARDQARYANQKSDLINEFQAFALALLDAMQPNVRYEAWRDEAMQSATDFRTARLGYVWHPGEQVLQHLIRDGLVTKRTHSIKGKRLAFYSVSATGATLITDDANSGGESAA